MKLNISKDLIAGLMFIFFGIAAIWLSRDFPMGSARHIGSAVFPSIVGGALALIGFVILARSFWSLSEPVLLPTLRPLIMITGATVGFALLLKPLGLVLSLFVLIVISSLEKLQFRLLLEVAIFYILLVLIVVFFFVYGLGLQFSLWPT